MRRSICHRFSFLKCNSYPDFCSKNLFLCGYFNCVYQEQSIAAEIVQLVIAGNSVEMHPGLFNGQVMIFIHLLKNEVC